LPSLLFKDYLVTFFLKISTVDTREITANTIMTTLISPVGGVVGLEGVVVGAVVVGVPVVVGAPVVGVVVVVGGLVVGVEGGVG